MKPINLYCNDDSQKPQQWRWPLLLIHFRKEHFHIFSECIRNNHLYSSSTKQFLISHFKLYFNMFVSCRVFCHHVIIKQVGAWANILKKLNSCRAVSSKFLLCCGAWFVCHNPRSFLLLKFLSMWIFRCQEKKKMTAESTFKILINVGKS